jgi:hypothetical protein
MMLARHRQARLLQIPPFLARQRAWFTKGAVAIFE